MGVNQESLCQSDVLVPSVILGSLATGETTNINLNATSISIVEPLLLLRNANTEILCRCKSDVEERAAAVNGMPPVNLINTVISRAGQCIHGVEFVRAVPLNMNYRFFFTHDEDFNNIRTTSKAASCLAARAVQFDEIKTGPQEILQSKQKCLLALFTKTSRPPCESSGRGTPKDFVYNFNHKLNLILNEPTIHRDLLDAAAFSLYIRQHMSPEIRETSFADRTAMADVFVAAFAKPPWNESWSQKSALAMIDEWMPCPGFYGLIGEMERQVVGFVFGRAETWDTKLTFYVKELCVKPDFQRRGIGSILSKELEGRLISKNVTSIYLLSLRDSLASLFYTRHSYKRSEQMCVFGKHLEKQSAT
jgi:aminoglycoside 6'-N-acetyltransferase I